jgi:hypothetical protein
MAEVRTALLIAKPGNDLLIFFTPELEEAVQGFASTKFVGAMLVLPPADVRSGASEIFSETLTIESAGD